MTARPRSLAGAHVDRPTGWRWWDGSEWSGSTPIDLVAPDGVES